MWEFGRPLLRYEVNLSLRCNLLPGFVAKIKFKFSSEFWKTSFYHQEPVSFPKVFSNEIDSDINKCDFFYYRMKCVNI